MKRFLLFLPYFFLTFFVQAQSTYKSKEGEVSFFSKAPIEDIEAYNQNINSLLNISTGDIAFIIPIREFKFKKPLMEEHFNEKYMESDKFPTATFKGKINEKIDFTADGE